MTEPKPPPQRPVANDEVTARERRLADALRANLARRKAQARRRAEEPPAPPHEES